MAEHFVSKSIFKFQVPQLQMNKQYFFSFLCSILSFCFFCPSHFAIFINCVYVCICVAQIIVQSIVSFISYGIKAYDRNNNRKCLNRPSTKRFPLMNLRIMSVLRYRFQSLHAILRRLFFFLFRFAGHAMHNIKTMLRYEQKKKKLAQMAPMSN